MPRRIAVLEPHQERVVQEKAELDARLERLVAFIGGATYRLLPEAERMDLRKQRTCMRNLSNILARRIARFTPGA